ncbi:HAD family hydrolase [Streptomyces sp. NBC_00576]|uniref:HAD family hydrolase n=1 Tax=Streptomyces sp. NBC_00576 TaxID=2903665 RepID=UPI002E7FF15D|nr:HAD-IB family phosphatase [Streptomyces sp. NBC_00576]WUB76991.1 HAD-IB family phosphatase [Streptomyces sp. NBC_00576]
MKSVPGKGSGPGDGPQPEAWAYTRAGNRSYYRLLRGESAKGLAAAGQAWFTAQWHESPHGLYVPEVEEALAGHRKSGHDLVLVSGSFFACLDPIASDVGAELVLSTRPVIRRGDLTGEVLAPMIGETKGRAVRLAGLLGGFDLARSSAYGDHISDLAMLREVGRPVVVGDHPELLAHGRRAGWGHLLTGATRR